MFPSLLDGVLLLVGLAFGWALARRGTVPAPPSREPATPYRAPVSATFVSEQPDDEIAALGRAIDAEPQAAGLQLTLGNVFRKRGQIDQAIRVHESVLARESLSPGEKRLTQLELARDYLKGGLLDRAEALLGPLSESADDAVPALEQMLEMYEMSQDWPAAIGLAQRLQSVSGRSGAARIAQYRCQQAEAARDAGDLVAAEREARAALNEDAACVRASLLLGALAEKTGQPGAAIDQYLRALEVDARYAPEVIEPVRRCFEAQSDTKGYAGFLDDAEKRLPGSTAVARARAAWIAARGEEPRAYLAGQLAGKPTRESLLLWLERPSELSIESEGLRKALDRSIRSRPRYRCRDCGLQPSLLFWQCPSCKHWGTVAPVEEAL